LMLLLPVVALATFYDTLGVYPTVGQDLLRQGFKKEAIALHPYYNSSKSLFEKFQRVALAYEMLA